MRVREHYYKGDILYIKCSGCGEVKASELFNKNKRKKFGIDSYCKECHSKKPQKKLNIEKVREYQRRYMERNYEHYINRQRAQRKRAKMEGKNYKKKYERKKTLDMGFSTHTFHQKTTKYIKENSLRPSECVICGKECKPQAHHPSYNNMKERENVVFVCDHCHKLIHTGELGCPVPVNLIELNAHMPMILTDKDLELCNI